MESTGQNRGYSQRMAGRAEQTPIDADIRAVFADARKACRADGEQGTHSDEAENKTKNAAGEGE